MAGERLVRILARLESAGTSEPGTVALCALAAELAAVTGAGIMLMAGDTPAGPLCTTDAVSARIEDLQTTSGEGPCVDAYRQDRPVVEPDLSDPANQRWPAFTPPAVDAGARAVFGFPLQVGAVRLGALNLYRDRRGPLSAEEHADTLVMAGVAARAILVMQAGAAPGQLAPALDAGAAFPYVVHQATGMVAAQLDCGMADALVRLRAHAFRTDRPLADVAADVVARRLRFGDDTEDHEPGSGRER